MSEPTELLIRGIVVGVFAENCWVIGSRRTGEAICIDPGDQPDDILALAKDMGVTIKRIANTHAHIDHILGVPGVKQATGASFLLPPGALDTARQAGRQAEMMLGRAGESVPEPDAFLADGDEVEVEGLKLKVIHTPGHTQGSVSFSTDGLLFSGDTLFRGSIGRTDLPGGDYAQGVESLGA